MRNLAPLFLTLLLTAFAFSSLSAQNLVSNSTFDDGSMGDWWTSAGLDANIVNGELCATASDGGENRWDAILGHSTLNLEAGRYQFFSFDFRAPEGLTVAVGLQLAEEPWTEYYGLDVVGTGERQRVDSPYQQIAADSAAQLSISFGGQGTATVCIDNVILGPPSVPPVEQNAIQVNQLGYFTTGAKQATVVTAQTDPLVWTLIDGRGATALQGMTTPFGTDASSDLNVQLIDFSSYENAGSGFKIQLAGIESHTFDISDNPLGELLRDGTRYFYFNRANTALEMPYVENAVWARPSGPTDNAVSCWPNSGCSYALDVSKGWYDAGDYGKYIVPSGVSVWMLMNLHERGLHIENSVLPQFADGALNIPESRNGVSDLLDEVRYNLEFMLGMQVPDGAPLAGMVHHKMHNTEWHEAGTSPTEMGSENRYLTPPTTIATLYFAAATAQCARVWQPIDAGFSAQCLASSQKAWQAALANPDVTHPDEPYNQGGGPYSNLDSGADITDEFYWAATELFITTDQDEYRSYLLASPNHLGPTQPPIYQIDMLPRISISTVPNNLSSDQQNAIRASVVAEANIYRERVNSSGFGVPVWEDGFYWGSNQLLLLMLQTLGVAADISGDQRYVDAAQQGFHYLFGRNPLGRSYMTGYGEYAVQNPTSTWYANSVNPLRPVAPPGFLVGGANRTHPDIFSTEALTGCVGTTCHFDHIRAYSTNEPAINITAPFVWVTSFLLSASGSATLLDENSLYLPIVIY